jgi:hypothetical protein
MKQIRITLTADLNGVLSFLKERYPILSEAEIIKMALSNQYIRKLREERNDKTHESTLQKRNGKKALRSWIK